jgi:tRNA threonylcarbamoyl adenosine modification protein YeaZ
MEGWGLVIETAGPSCQVGLLKEGTPIGGIVWDWPQRHSEKLISLVQLVLETEKLSWDQIRYAVYHQGPGSHTGLRIGLAAVKAWALSLGWEIYPVPLMRVLARIGQKKIPSEAPFLCLWETRNGQAYGQWWRGADPVQEPVLRPLTEWTQEVSGNTWIVGNVLLSPASNVHIATPSWQDVGKAATGVVPLRSSEAISGLVPLYFRPFIPTQRRA